MSVKVRGLLASGWIVPFLSVAILSVASLAAAPSDLRLIEAVKTRNTESVRALLKQRVDVNASQADGATALHWAAHWDDLDTATLLIRAGANASAANDLGVTPLALACANANAALVGALLKAGANANAAVWAGDTVLMACARTGSVEAVRLLLTQGANVNAKEREDGQTAVMWAVAQRHPEIVRVLIAHGADVHARSRERMGWDEAGNEVKYPRKAGGFTPLLFGALNGGVESARLLVEAGANVNDTAADGNSALALAAHSGHGPVAIYLLERGANPDAAGAGYTALHGAVLRGDADLVKALLARGANPNLRVTKGTPIRQFANDWGLATVVSATPFWMAAKFCEPRIMRLLADSGADTRLSMPDGTTPLMAAAGVGWRSGSDRRGRNLVLVSETADETSALESAKVALEMGADVNAVNKAGETALHGAAAKGFDAIIQLLVDKGANVNVKNDRGDTPLQLVLRRGKENQVDGLGAEAFVSTEQLLRKLGANQ